ncbi:MAG: DUF362 domain-containing protein [Treponemataceae bacterium]
MENSKVYMTNFRTTATENLPQKFKRLIKKAGIDGIDFNGKFVAIKMHFGEEGNLAFLRPNYARAVVDVVKQLGGKPFLTDCNTLYVGRRKNALDHLDNAFLNGFSPFSTDCHVIIGDGLKGTDEVSIPIKNGVYLKEAKIGRAIMDADIFISLTHFKGHEATGIGAALKNIGMGCGSRAGKMAMHNDGKPSINKDLCIGCGGCQKVCAHNAITIEAKKAQINHTNCVGCGRCIGVCPTDAVFTNWDETNEKLNAKIAEYSVAVLNGRPHFHISVVMDVSPNCDCHSENDAPIVPDVGMFASFDPVALDQACADEVLKMPSIKGSVMDECDTKHGNHFTNLHPTTDWAGQMLYAEKLGLGTRKYELIKI